MLWQMIFWVGIFGISLAVLIQAANVFTKAAEHVGLYWRLPPFVIGVTIVSLGTTIPELSSAIVAVWRGATEVVPANVIGSNIANIALVLGLAALITPYFKTSWQLIKTELPILVGAVALTTLLLLDGVLALPEAALLLAAYFMYLLITLALRDKYRHHFHLPTLERRLIINWPKTVFKLLAAPAFIYLGAQFTVDALINLSALAGLSTGLMGATLLAAGTSLPELTIAIQASRHGKPELAAGNVLGANIMNLLFVMGVAGLIAPLTVSPAMITIGLPMMLIVTALYFLVNRDRRITKKEGFLLVALYIFFIAALVVFDFA